MANDILYIDSMWLLWYSYNIILCVKPLTDILDM